MADLTYHGDTQTNTESQTHKYTHMHGDTFRYTYTETHISIHAYTHTQRPSDTDTETHMPQGISIGGPALGDLESLDGQGSYESVGEEQSEVTSGAR